jgi:hypothetical protein
VRLNQSAGLSITHRAARDFPAVAILATHTRSGNAIRVCKYKIGLEQGHLQVSNLNHIEFPAQHHA